MTYLQPLPKIFSDNRSLHNGRRLSTSLFPFIRSRYFPPAPKVATPPDHTERCSDNLEDHRLERIAGDRRQEGVFGSVCRDGLLVGTGGFARRTSPECIGLREEAEAEQ